MSWYTDVFLPALARLRAGKTKPRTKSDLKIKEVKGYKTITYYFKVRRATTGVDDDRAFSKEWFLNGKKFRRSLELPWNKQFQGSGWKIKCKLYIHETDDKRSPKKLIDTKEVTL